MANVYTRATKYSTQSIVAKAYSEYLDRVSDNYSIMLTGLTKAIDGIDSSTNIENFAVNVINDINAENGTDFTVNDNFVLNDGVVKYGDLLTSIASQIKNECQSIDNDTTVSELDVNVNIPLINSTSKVYNLKDLLTEINGTFHAVIAEKAGATALALGTTVAERLTIIRDTVSSYFNNAFSDVSNYLTSVVERIKTNCSVTQFITGTLNKGGIDAAASDGTVLSASEDATYYGSTPSAAIATNSALKSVITLGANALRSVCTAAKTILNGAINLAWKANRYIHRKGLEILVDPYDVEYINDNGNNTFDQFYYETEQNLLYFNDRYGDGHSHLIDKLAKGPLRFDLFACECVLYLPDGFSYTPFTDITTAFTWVCKYRYDITLDVSNGLYDGLIADLSLDSTEYPDLLSIAKLIGLNLTTVLDCLEEYHKYVFTVKVKTMIKYKPILTEFIKTFLENKLSTEDDYDHFSPKSVYDLLDALAMNTPYSSVDVHEENFYQDTITGITLAQLCLQVLYWESEGLDLSSISTSTEDDVLLPTSLTAVLAHTPDPSMTVDPLFGIITNKDFFDLITDLTVNSTTAIVSDIDLSSLMNTDYWWNVIDNIIEYETANPFTYSFWPYVQKQINWEDSSFNLKSDQQIQDEMNTWVTRAVVVALVAWIGFKVGSALRTTVLKASFNLMGAEWNVTEAASKGILTIDMLRTYKKAKLKYGVLNFLTGNLVSTAADVYAKSKNVAVNNYDEVSVDLSPVITLITGN